MIDFLASEGIALRRLPSWPDYWPGLGRVRARAHRGVAIVRHQSTGEWKSKLRPGFLAVPANLDEAMQLPYMKRSWASKKTLARVIGRTLIEASGKHLVTAGQALQGQMLHHACRRASISSMPAPGCCCRTAASALRQERTAPTGRLARLGVLINTGGFSRNQQMLDQYIPAPRLRGRPLHRASTAR